jgi:asparagine synthase (glutamine-hydrolysing)
MLNQGQNLSAQNPGIREKGKTGMIGICGFLKDGNAEDNLNLLRKIADKSEGRWHDSEHAVYIGECSLPNPARDSAAGAAPAVWRNYTLWCAGEVLNREELGAPEDSQNQAVARLLAEQGAAGLDKIDGAFTLARWDGQSLLLARDHFGVLPLYYGFLGNTFVFSSKLATFRDFPEVSGEVDPEGLTAFIKFNVIPGSLTIYRQIKKLAPGHFLTVKKGEAPEIKPFFNPVAVNNQACQNLLRGDDEQICDQLQALLRANVKRQFRPKSVLMLSGGIDSSLMLALLSEQGPIQAITAGFAGSAAFDESKYAAQAAGHLGVKHTVVNMSGQDIRETVAGMYDIFEEPFADISQIAAIYALNFAKQNLGIDTVFVGDAGDEFFMGYAAQREYIDYGIPADPVSGKYTFASYAQYPKRALMHFLFNRDVDYYKNLVANRLYAKTLLNPVEPDSVLREMANINSVTDHLRRAALFGIVVGLPAVVVVKYNRIAEFLNLTLRTPLLNNQTFSFSRRLPEHLFHRQDALKVSLRKILARYYPPEFFDRPKSGFTAPLNDWLRGPLQAWAEEMIAPDKLREQGFFNVDFVRNTWEKKTRHLEKLWAVFMFQAWLDKNRA